MDQSNLVCIQNVNKLDICEKIESEYVEWISNMLFREHALALSASSVNLLKREIRSDWPLYSGYLGRFIVICIEKKMGGMAGIKYASKGICELKRLYITPPFRRLGLGRLLVESLIAEARLLGYSSVRLETLDFMLEAISLYESLGFARIAEFDGAEGRGYGIQGYEIYFALDLLSSI